jgi:ferrochelatase
MQIAWQEARAQLNPSVGLRVLFSAHGLPEAIVEAGDPYQWQIEQTVASVLAAWNQDVDCTICYQSRATPQRWIEPSTEQEIERAAHEKSAVLVVPVAFVSEHSETLVELDADYRRLAERLGVPGYFRVPTQNSDAAFIAALANLVRHARRCGPGLCGQADRRICPADRSLCPWP